MSDLGGATVLVVENNAHMRRMLDVVLQALGVGRVLQAPDSLTGFLYTTHERIDIVLLDYLLGDRNGAEFVHLLRNDTASMNRYTPIVMITAMPEHPGIGAALAAGAQAVLAKPVQPALLYDALSGTMAPRRRPARGSAKTDRPRYTWHDSRESLGLTGS